MVRLGRVAVVGFAAAVVTSNARAAGPPDELVFRGDGVVIRLVRPGDHGTIERAGQSFPFTATHHGHKLTGTFTAGGRPFPFTFDQADAPGWAELKSGGKTYALADATPGQRPVVLRAAGGVVLRLDNEAGSAGTFERDGRPVRFTATRPTVGPDESLGLPATLADGRRVTFTIARGQGDRYAVTADGIKYDMARDADAKADDRPRTEAPAAAAGRTVVLERRPVRDAQTQLTVATVLVPRGWVQDDGIRWQPQLNQFYAVETVVGDVAAGHTVRWLPTAQFTASTALYNTARQNGGPAVSNGIELAPRVFTPERYVTQVTLPRCGRGFADVRVTRVTPCRPWPGRPWRRTRPRPRPAPPAGTSSTPPPPACRSRTRPPTAGRSTRLSAASWSTTGTSRPTPAPAGWAFPTASRS